MATIQDLARAAGVSVATVSKALNNYPDVGDETRRRIVALAQEMGFQPSRAALTLVTGRSHLVGVFYLQEYQSGVMFHPFFTEVFIGFKRMVGQAGYDLYSFTSRHEERERFSFVQLCRHHRLDGIVLMGVDSADPQVHDLAHSGIPCMSIDNDLISTRAGYVISDNVGGAMQAMHHLFSLGHRKIAFINGMLRSRPGHDRFIGYRQALDSVGLPYRQDYVLHSDFTAENGYAGMRQLLDLADPPTAVFCAADTMAFGAIRALHEAGLRVPQDVAVVGFDDIEMASLFIPALTTVRQDKDGLGSLAGEALVRMIEEPGFVPPGTVVPTQLIIRESCGAPPPA